MTQDLILNFLRRYNFYDSVCRYEFNENGLNVYGNVKLNSRLIYLPFKFNIIDGNFDVSFCNIRTLHNGPNKVIGSFICDCSQLVTANISNVMCSEFRFFLCRELTHISSLSNANFIDIRGCTKLTEISLLNLLVDENAKIRSFNANNGTISSIDENIWCNSKHYCYFHEIKSLVDNSNLDLVID